MKTNSILKGLAACLVAVSLTACDKAKDDLTKAADATKDAAGKAVDAAKDTMAGAATNAMAAVAGPVGDALGAAQKDLAAKNYQGALDDLKKLDGVQLTPDQQKMVDDLKAQAAKLLTGATAGATDAAGAAAAALPK